MPISRDVRRQAARLRADLNFRTPDAIHAATGLEASCILFVANDYDLRRVPGLSVVVLGDLISP
ncbi:MAG TPA: PIN domain-containing protein [Blastocatellia bacterium]|nr:PIN domain-containing protein [Blastocatellia bacterium]